MAWQLHYTSARNGPTGRAGFQFVAETPGLPDGVRAGVTPHLSYRPPPGAPLSPDGGELDLFPVALLYDRVGGRPLLLRCRYLGRDYSGRYGNFFGHAVVADPGELEGVRPAELWHSPVWADAPAEGADLPEVDELAPGEAFAPEALAEWLADTASFGTDGTAETGGTGGADEPGGAAGTGSQAGGAYGMLARLVDAVAGVLARGHGRVVLVGADDELIARWIAVVSYSLPVAAAARLSFVTYSADPGGAAQRLVGTTPDVWASAGQHAASDAFFTDSWTSTREAPPGRFARTVAACWRDLDFAGLDALGELAMLDAKAAADGGAEAGPGRGAGLDGAAALLALCRGGASVAGAEEDAAAGLLTRHGAAIPEWVWQDLAPGVPSMGFDLAVAVRDRARAAGAAEVAERCALRATVLALTDQAARERLERTGPWSVPPGELAPETSAALAAAPDLTEVAAIAAVAERAGAPAPPSDVTAAAAECARRGAADVPAAFRACPEGAREALLDGVLDGLARAAAADRSAALTAVACEVLYEHAARLRETPAVALEVLAATGRRRRDRRVAVTGELLALDAAPAELDPAFTRVWEDPPTAAECLDLLDAHAASLAGHPALAALPSRTFTRLAARIAPPEETSGGDALSEAATLRLAARVGAVLPGGRAARDATAVRAYTDAITAERPEGAARALGTLIGTAGSSPRLVDAAFTAAARRLCRRPPRFRADLLGAAAPTVRTRLGARWTGELPGRARAGRSPLRGAEIEQRNDLVEVVLRLRVRGVTEPALAAWARSAVTRWLSARQLDAHFSGDPDLRAALKDLLAETRGGR